MSKLKRFNVKVTYRNGYSHIEVWAKDFGAACASIYKSESKKLNFPDSFQLVSIDE